MITFRFDDVSVNTNLDKLAALIAVIHDEEPKAEILLAVSPIVFSSDQLGDATSERVHPSLLTAMSALSPYYEGRNCGLPDISDVLVRKYGCTHLRRAGHGLVHVDHRLLSRDAQEMSIITSCALVGGSAFVPPYNKWNAITESICNEHRIDLVKFEEGWRHVAHNRFSTTRSLWYLHPYDLTPVELKTWFLYGAAKAAGAL